MTNSSTIEMENYSPFCALITLPDIGIGGTISLKGNFGAGDDTGDGTGEGGDSGGVPGAMKTGKEDASTAGNNNRGSMVENTTMKSLPLPSGIDGTQHQQHSINHRQEQQQQQQPQKKQKLQQMQEIATGLATSADIVTIGGLGTKMAPAAVEAILAGGTEIPPDKTLGIRDRAEEGKLGRGSNRAGVGRGLPIWPEALPLPAAAPADNCGGACEPTGRAERGKGVRSACYLDIEVLKAVSRLFLSKLQVAVEVGHKYGVASVIRAELWAWCWGKDQRWVVDFVLGQW